MIRVLIADDHAAVREGLVALIDREPDLTVVARASNGEEAVALFRVHTPDVLLSDLKMPLRDGAEAIRTLRDEFPQGCFIVLTNSDSDTDRHRCLEAGAHTVLLKGTPPDNLFATIRALANENPASNDSFAFDAPKSRRAREMWPKAR